MNKEVFTVDGYSSGQQSKEFVYSVPAPFGPKRGEAEFRVTAKTASIFNVEYKTKIEAIQHRIRVNEFKRKKLYEQNNNVNTLIRTEKEDLRKGVEELYEAFYDECILKWSTTIQRDGKDLEATRENWLALQEFNHSDIVVIFDKLRTDLNDLSSLMENSENAIENEELGN